MRSQNSSIGTAFGQRKLPRPLLFPEGNRHLMTGECGGEKTQTPFSIEGTLKVHSRSGGPESVG